MVPEYVEKVVVNVSLEEQKRFAIVAKRFFVSGLVTFGLLFVAGWLFLFINGSVTIPKDNWGVLFIILGVFGMWATVSFLTVGFFIGSLVYSIKAIGSKNSFVFSSSIVLLVNFVQCLPLLFILSVNSFV